MLVSCHASNQGFRPASSAGALTNEAGGLKVDVTLASPVTLLLLPLIATAIGGGASSSIVDGRTESEVGVIRVRITDTDPPPPMSEGSLIAPREGWVGLKHTVDGGATWSAPLLSTKVLVAFGLGGETEAELIYDELLSDTYFISSARGWMKIRYGSRKGVWQTTDGGRTWRRMPPPSPDVIAFADRSYGWMSIRTNEGYQNRTTQTGGDSWRDCGGTGSAGAFEHVVLRDSRRGWASWTRKSGDHFNYGIARTRDGGCSWSDVWQTTEVLDTVAEVQFADDDHGWIVNISPAKVLYTSDSGATWVHLDLPSTDSLESAFFAKSGEVWIMTTCGALFRRTSGGKTWSSVPSDAEAARQLRWPRLRLREIARGTRSLACCPVGSDVATDRGDPRCPRDGGRTR
jgi:Photosynthesis system II assembly factor YCF48